MENGVEEWKPISGYEGWYAISNYGRVKRVKYWKGVKRPILKGTIMTIGYRSVMLSMDSAIIRERKYIHALVAEAFIGPRPSGFVINHKDSNKLNNFVWNLEYTTQIGNVRHAVEAGRFSKGVECHNAKLDDCKIREIRALRGLYTTRDLGDMYGVSCAVISEIHNRKIWKHVT